MTNSYQHDEKVDPARRAAADQAASQAISYPAVPALQKMSFEGNSSPNTVCQLMEVTQLEKRNRKKRKKMMTRMSGSRQASAGSTGKLLARR